MKDCHWLKPQLVAQIEFTEWTPDGYLRHAKYVGLRPEKKARDVVNLMDALKESMKTIQRGGQRAEQKRRRKA